MNNAEKMADENRRSVRKKAQVHMSETIAVLFIFFVLVLFGLIFYYQYQKVAFAEKQEELLAARAMDTTLKALFLPELQCSKQEAEPEENCFDLMKLRGAGEVFKNNLAKYYFELFSYAKITVKQIYPLYPVQDPVQNSAQSSLQGRQSSLQNSYILYDNPKPDFTRKELTYFVVTLKDETAGSYGLAEYGFGYIQVEVYS